MGMKNGEIRVCGKIHDVITDSLLEEVYEIDVAGYMRDSLKKWGDLLCMPHHGYRFPKLTGE
jgi:ABC-type cobalamin/Fe3+-siderophores transport system ATPase subunit